MSTTSDTGVRRPTFPHTSTPGTFRSKTGATTRNLGDVSIRRSCSVEPPGHADRRPTGGNRRGPLPGGHFRENERSRIRFRQPRSSASRSSAAGQQKTGKNRLVVCAVLTSPRSPAVSGTNPQMTSEIQGIFASSAFTTPVERLVRPQVQSVSGKFPTQWNRDIFRRNSEVYPRIREQISAGSEPAEQLRVLAPSRPRVMTTQPSELHPEADV